MAHLAAVVCPFNPYGCESRRRDFEQFVGEMSRPDIRLYPVKLVYDGKPEFPTVPGADPLVLFGGAVLWQKERLLNLRIDLALHDGAEAVAWLDADIMFCESDWPYATLRALDQYDIVQPFMQAIAAYSSGTQAKRAILAPPEPDLVPALGFVWEARGEVLRATRRLYDACVLGGSDFATYLGFSKSRTRKPEHARCSQTQRTQRLLSGADRRSVCLERSQ